MSLVSPVPSPAYLAEDTGPSIIGTASLLIFFSTVFVILRYWARHLTQTKFSAEDVIIPFAWLVEVGLCITGIVMVKKASTGRHMDYVVMTDAHKIMEHYKGILIQEVLHLPAVAFPKLCIVLLYLKVFTNKWARMATWALIYIIVATWISFFVAAMFQCLPFAYNWDKTIPGGHCFNVIVFGHSSSIPNIVTDVAVLVLPIRTVMDLKVSVGRRIGLLLIFLTGSVGMIASIIRTVVFSTVNPIKDVTFAHTPLVNWTMIEPGMYLLAACALSFKPLFRMVARALHLESFVTHTRSFVGKATGKTNNKTGTTQTDIYVDTRESRASDGGKKLHSGHDDSDEEAEIGLKNAKGELGLRVLVTKTLEMGVEARGEK